VVGLIDVLAGEISSGGDFLTYPKLRKTDQKAKHLKNFEVPDQQWGQNEK